VTGVQTCALPICFLIERLSVTIAFRYFGVAGMAAAGIVFFIGLLKRIDSRVKYKEKTGG
jgi:hypothetical protein